MQDVY